MILECDYPGCPWVIDSDEIPAGSSVPAETRLRMHRSNKHKITGGGPIDVPELEMSSTGADGTGPYGGAPATDEVPPAPGGGNRSAGAEPATRRRGFLDRLRKPKVEVVDPGGVSKREKAPKPPKGYPKGGRQSAADTIADIWGWGGGQFQRVGHVPTGRMIRFQAPVTGEILDDVLKGTALDKIVVQRIVGYRGKIDQLVAVFGPPVLTWQMEKAMSQGNDAAVENLEMMLKSTIRDALPVMLPALKKVRKREVETNAAMADLLDDDDLAALGITMVSGKPVDQDGRVVDVADVFVSMLFADWTAPVAPPAEPAEQPEETVT